ncbi:M23 family metallopeptidase [Oscillospiraceae bacterium PP1C4]
MNFKLSLSVCVLAALLSACTLNPAANKAESESVSASRPVSATSAVSSAPEAASASTTASESTSTASSASEAASAASSAPDVANVVFSAPEAVNMASSAPDGAPALAISANGTELLLKSKGKPQQITVVSPDALPSVADGSNIAVKITADGQPVFEGSSAQLNTFSPKQNGQYLYEFTVADGAAAGTYQVAANCKFQPQISFSSPKVTLGEALVLHANYVDGMKVTATTDLPFQPKFYAYDGGMMAILPVAYTTPVGTYQLKIQAGAQNFHYTISVQGRDFVVQNLTVDAGVTANTAKSDTANAEWATKIEPLKKISEPVKYWSGAFLQPVQGEITTEFGVIRYTNGSKIATRHSGIDIAASQGTQIAAANAGKVQFADFLQLTGNTVVLDHGMGLKSFYYHMNSLDVTAGTLVKKGDPIGKVGTTGFSTGPHLHYSLLVNDVFINPWTAFDQGIE